MVGRLLSVFWYFYFWIKNNVVLLYGIYQVWLLPKPRVSFFGGAKFDINSQYGLAAQELARLCASNNISILHGGGSGIMSAVACSINRDSNSLGISIEGLSTFEPPSPCHGKFIKMLSLSARKWLLIQYSQAFVIFPGGFGTVDEFAEVITLLQIRSLKPVPVVLFGADYWHLFLRWIDEVAITSGAIEPSIRELFIVTDDIKVAFSLVLMNCG